MTEFDKHLISTNLLGATTYEELNEKERELTFKRVVALQNNKILVTGNFDYQHLKDIHKYLFKDVYTWAGQDRLEMGLNEQFGNKFGKMDKKGYITHFVPTDQLPKFADEIFTELKKENNLLNLNIDKFAEKSANFLMEINALHPFREGNGRTQRIFLNQLAENAGYKMDLNLIEKEKFTEAVTMASRDLNPKPLEALIKENLKSFEINLKQEPKSTIAKNGEIIMSKEAAKKLKEEISDQNVNKDLDINR